MAKNINKYNSKENFDYAVKEVLNYYYDKDQSKKINQFKAVIDSRADDLIKDYEDASEEKQNDEELGYKPGEVIVEFENDVNKELKEAVEWPLKHPEKFEKFGVRPPKGTLLYGVPGTGKTLLAKAVASESEANFISIKGPELLSKWVGESEQGVREVFRKAKQTAPTVIFFDEIDSIASTRSANDSDSGVTKRVVNQLLTEMDGLEELEDVAIIAATNRPDILDAGLMRPGRFDRHIKVDLPNEDARLSIFKVHTEGMPLADDVSLEKLAKQTDGYVGADIEAVCREAAMLTLRNNLDAENVPYKYFKEALEKVKPSNSPGDQVQYI